MRPMWLGLSGWVGGVEDDAVREAVGTRLVGLYKNLGFGREMGNDRNIMI